MSDKFTETFFAWAATNGIDRNQIAEATGNSAQTISKWRSIGIPKGKQLGCQSLIDQHKLDAYKEIRHSIPLQPSHAQFRRWNQAALDQGKLIEDWAFNGLDLLADEHFREQNIALAAEDQDHFNGIKPNTEDLPT